jgi:hypothetical protein
LIAQVFLVVAVAVAYGGIAGAESARGAAFGGGIALANGLLLFWRYHRGNQSHADPGRHLRSFVASAIERFVMVAALFAIGFGILKLAPLPLLIGFIAVQAGLLVAGLRQNN